jgi:ubiquinone/menaquinone biosynthesis C-methylase UbiE
MQSLAKMAQLAQAFPERDLCGVGGISGWAEALSYFLLGCGTVQVATAAMLDHAVGPNVIRRLSDGMSEFLDRHADRGWRTLDDVRGLRRDAVVPHASIPRTGSNAHASHDPGSTRFDEKAADWDTPERQDFARQVAGIIREHVALGRTERVIDIGAGTGLLGLELAADVGSVLLAEPSAGMLEVARAKLAHGPANATAVAFDLTADPPPGAPFDVAVSLLVLHHVADTDAALRAIAALVVSGGRIALLDLDAEDGTFHEADAEGIHHHGFEHRELLRRAADAGFTDLEVRNVTSIEREGRDYPLFLLTARVP